MRLNFGREGFIFFSFYRFQKIYPDNTIIEFPVILNQHKRKQKKRFPVKLILFGKPRDFLDYQNNQPEACEEIHAVMDRLERETAKKEKRRTSGSGIEGEPKKL